MRGRGRRTAIEIFFCSAFLLWLTAATAQAAVTDAPHNDDSGITCTSCHRYSLWWSYSPAQKRSDFASLVDTLCLDCHKDTGTGPKVSTHSSAVINSSLHGEWGRACTACHDPHFQDQLKWANSAPAPYLVTGTISGVAYDSARNETTITYSEATSNVKWPAEGLNADDLDWANKSLSNQGRGLILVQDTVKTASTYLIVGASATTVTVKGEIKDSTIDPDGVDQVTNTQNSATCNSFGLIYGDLIRNSINSMPVKFFDPNGGFVRTEDPAATGICQACHTGTTHYANDGVMPSGSDTHLGRDGMNCTICHQHIEGFKGTGHDSKSFGWGSGNCATCHNPSGASINITNVIHGAKCGLCHLSAAGGDARKDGDPSNGVDGSAVDATNSSTCVDCHINKLPLTSRAIHHESAHDYAANGDCTQCHDSAEGKLVAPHDTLVTESAECVWCHAATAGLATGMPVSTTNNKVHDACTTCHKTDGSLKAPYGKAIAIPAGGGNCITCHGQYFLNHANVDSYHNVFLRKDGTSCESCHNQSGNAAANVVSDIHKIADYKLIPGYLGNRVGQVVCELCHNKTTGELVNGITVGQNWAATGQSFMTGDARKHTMGTTSNCAVCHSYSLNLPPPYANLSMGTAQNHPHDTHYDNIGAEARCLRCHTAWNPPYFSTDEHGNYEVHPLMCNTCHGSNYARKGSALNHTVGSPSTCSTCHPASSPAQSYHGFTNGAEGLEGGTIKNAFIFKTIFAGTTATVASCMSSADGGATWAAGVVWDMQGTDPASVTCQYSYSNLPNGPVTLKMKATTTSGVEMNSDVLRANVTSGPKDGASLTVTPGDGQNTLTWDAATDTSFGLRGTNTYDVRWISGDFDTTRYIFDCTERTVWSSFYNGYVQSTPGTSVYTGTATSFVHNTGLPVNVKASYLVCAYNSIGAVSAGLAGFATITSGPTQYYVKSNLSSTEPPPLTTLTFANSNATYLTASAHSYQPATPIGTGPKTLLTVLSGVVSSGTNKTITAMTSKFSLKSTSASDLWTFNVYAYDPTTTNKVLVATSGEMTASVEQKDWYPAMAIQNGGMVPMGNKLMLEVIYNAPSVSPRPTFYNNHQGQSTESRISVTYAP